MTGTMLKASPLNDPLKDWPNDDLLLTEKSRLRLAATRPALLRVLDWPELRETFARHEDPARIGKRWNHRQGVASVLFSGLGVVLLSISPIIPPDLLGLITAVATISMFVGGLVGVLHWGLLRSRHNWLGHRFWTERLRQLHFQSLVNHIDLAADAMTNDDALADLTQRRRVWLADLYDDADDPRHRIRAILQDRTEARAWIRPEWQHEQPPAGTSFEVDQILEGLHGLRLGIQLSYSSKNLGPDVYSPPTRSQYLKGTANLCFLLVMLVAGAGVVSALTGQPVLGLSAAAWTTVAAVASAVGLMAQSINQGLQNEAELDRYEWYAEELDQIRTAYELGGRQQRIKALRRLEHASYRELRMFLRAHSAARFTG